MRKCVAGIADFMGQNAIIRVDRKPVDEHLLDGFVVGMSDKLLLLHVVDGSTLLLNGYSAIRLSDIHSYHVDETFVTRALRLLDRKPIVPEGIDLSGWAELLASVQRKYPLVLIETEKKEPGCGFIGRVAKQTTRYAALEKINTKGQWDETEQFAFKDITQVEFDDGYVNALAHLVACQAYAGK